MLQQRVGKREYLLASQFLLPAAGLGKVMWITVRPRVRRRLIQTIGCEDRNQPPGSSSGVTSNPLPKSTAAPPAANNVTDQWLGKWIGPEGTYLVLSKNLDKYIVEIHSLDGPASYDGISAGNRIGLS